MYCVNPRVKKIYFPHLPVAITGTSINGAVTKYIVASKHGYLRRTFVRRDLSHRKKIHCTNTELGFRCGGFKKNLSLQDACNELAVGTTCNCT
jgi:hypothetical protein